MSTTIESLELEIVSNSKSAVSGIDALTQSLMKLKKATKGGLGLSSVSKEIGKVDKATKQMTTSNKNASKSFTDLFYKVKVGANSFKLLGDKIWSSIEKSNDYIENVNLFTVSMGEYADGAMKYAEIVSDAMGIDTSEWIRAQGIFMTLSTGFGVAGDRAAIMSKNLTQLGYDLSSFFNISTEDAMQKLQSGLSGELEPLRRLGYDLSQAKLEATAFELGITKSVSEMTQAEKAQLRYYAIMTQVTTAQGDMARTLDDPANQLRVLRAQLNMAAREIGNIFIPTLNAILPYAIAVTKVIRSLANTIAGLFGYEMPEIEGVTGTVVENTDAVTENLEESQKAAKKLKSYMLGFDELNVINPNTDSGVGKDDPLGEFEFALPEYDFMAGLVESKVAKIVEDMKEWLGITEDIDSWSELLDTRLGSILKTVGLIGLGIAAWKVTKTFMDSITALQSLLSNPSYAIAISAILTITGLVISFDGMESAVEDGLDGFNFAEIVGGGLLGGGSAALFGSKIATWITTTFAGSKVATALATAATNLGLGTAGAVGAALAAGIVGIIVGIPAYFVGIYDAIKNELDWLNGVLIGLGATAAGAAIGAIIGACGGPVTAGIGALIGLAVGLITDFTILLWQHFDEIAEWFKELPLLAKACIVALGIALTVSNPGFLVLSVITMIIAGVKTVIEVVKKIPDAISEIGKFIVNLPETISTAFEKVSEWVSNLPANIKKKLDEIGEELDALPEKIKTWFEGVREKIKQWFTDLWQPIKDYDWGALGKNIAKWFGSAIKTAYDFVTESIPKWFEDVGVSIGAGFKTFFTETLPTFFAETLPALVTYTAEFFKELPDRIGAVIIAIWDGLKGVGKEILNGIFEGFSTVGTAIKEFLKGFVDGFKEGLGIHSPSTVFKEIGEYLIEGLLEGISETWKTITTFFSTTFEKLKTSFATAWGKIKTTVTDIFDEMWKYIKTPINSILGGVEKMTNGVINGLNAMIRALNNLSFDVPDWVPVIGGSKFGLNISTLSTISIPRLADGGFVDEGQMFIAREAGAEMVGNIGRRTAVANNDQIVSGIAGGVAQANEEQNVLLREQNSLLRALLEKDSGVYLDGKNLTDSVEKYQRERGRVLISGGVI